MRILEFSGRLQNAGEASFPDIVMPDIKGEQQMLSKVDAKVILVHFWDATDAAQKMMNLDTLLPLYNDFHKRGFEIFAIGCTPDKPEWASTVLAQKLPWINVNDGLGTASRSLYTFNVAAVPAMILLTDSGMDFIQGEKQLRAKIEKAL